MNKVMTQEEKELMIKDLCGRLPYGVIVQVNDGLRGAYDSRLVQVFCDRASCSVNVCNPLKECICIDSVKPYLRSMYSMTEEEYNDMYNQLYLSQKEFYTNCSNTDYIGKYIKLIANDTVNDWLNKNMFDYRGLIKRGLALEAPEGIYELELLDDWLPSQNESDSMIDKATQITVGCKIRSKTNPDEILSIVSDDCHGDEFECSNGSVLSLRQIKKYYDIYIEENKGTIVIN